MRKAVIFIVGLVALALRSSDASARKLTQATDPRYEGLQSVAPSMAIYFGGVYQIGDV